MDHGAQEGSPGTCGRTLECVHIAPFLYGLTTRNVGRKISHSHDSDSPLDWTRRSGLRLGLWNFLSRTTPISYPPASDVGSYSSFGVACFSLVVLDTQRVQDMDSSPALVSLGHGALVPRLTATTSDSTHFSLQTLITLAYNKVGRGFLSI